MRLLVLYIFLFLNIPTYASQEKSEAKTYLNKALVSLENSDFPEAMKLFTRSIELADSLSDEHSWLVSIGYISNIYLNSGDYGRCIYYQKKGYEKAKKIKNIHFQKRFLTNMVAACCKAGRVEEAKKYLRYFRELQTQNDDCSTRYYYLYNDARISTSEGKFDEAIRKHLVALDYARKNNMADSYILFQYCEIGNLYLKKADYAKAIEWGEKCLKTDSPDLMTAVNKLLADAYMMLGEEAKGEYYNNKYLIMQDSVFNRGRMCSAGNELFEYESRVTDKQINSLNGTISKQMISLVVFAVLLLALIVVSLFLYRNNRRLNAAYRLLIRKDKEKEKQEEHTKRLLEETLQHAAHVENNKDIAEHSDDLQNDDLRMQDKKDANGGICLSDDSKNRLLNSVLEVMKDVAFISNPDFSLNALADAVGSNTRYVSWVINDTYGKNFKTMLNEYRIKEACRRLLDKEHYGNMTIQAIYEEVGYTNNVSFIRAFKKINGMTPSEYQKQYKIEESQNHFGDNE